MFFQKISIKCDKFICQDIWIKNLIDNSEIWIRNWSNNVINFYKQYYSIGTNNFTIIISVSDEWRDNIVYEINLDKFDYKSEINIIIENNEILFDC